MAEALCKHHIIYQSEDNRIFLIDIPQSIESAQGDLDKVKCSRTLFSSEPLKTPYRNVEPATKGAALNNFSRYVTLHSLYASIVREALEDIAEHLDVSEEWCSSRCVSPAAPSAGRNKKRRYDIVEQASFSFESELKECLSSLQNNGNSRSHFPAISLRSQCDATYQLQNWDGSLSNNSAVPQILSISQPSRTFNFTIPPKSSFMIGDVRDASSCGRQFDFVLLDPPWPNKSVKRSRSYNIANDPRDISELLSSLSLEEWVKEDGYIGVWITNAARYREMVLSMFETWQVCLVEEWIWIKVTTGGEPVTAVDGTWRKPYEILLIGRRTSNVKSDMIRSYFDGSSTVNEEGRVKRRDTTGVPDLDDSSTMTGNGRVKRRVIAGVPDLHSRKPCLKDILKRTLFNNPMLSARLTMAEFFGRYLVSEWFCCGDEVLKFNYDEYWVSCNSIK